MTIRIGIIAPITGRYNYFGVPIRNGAVLALEEISGPHLPIAWVERDNRGEIDLTRRMIDELDREGVLAVIGPVESHVAAVAAEESRERQLPMITPSATASYLTSPDNPWFFRAISSDIDRARVLADWVRQDLGDQKVLVVHERRTEKEREREAPLLYGESAARDFATILSDKGYPFSTLGFDRTNVLSNALKKNLSRHMRLKDVSAAAIFAPSAEIITVAGYLRSLNDSFPIYMVSPGRDLFERSSINDNVKAVTDTIIEDMDAAELDQFRARYNARFPDEPDDPIYQYATFAYDACFIIAAAVKEALGREAVDASDIRSLREIFRECLSGSPPRTDLLMSTGNFTARNDLVFKPNRRVLKRGQWESPGANESVAVTAKPPDPASQSPKSCRYDAFISYRHEEKDRDFAVDLLRKLERDGYRIAIDERDFSPQAAFLEEMERCVRESCFTLAVVSSSWLASSATKEEAIITKVRDMEDRQRRLIPLHIEKVGEMPSWLYGLVGVDFTASSPLVDPIDRLKGALGKPVGAS